MPIKDPERRKQACRSWRSRNPDRVKELCWKQHGINLTGREFRELLERQGDKCAICRTDTPGGRGTFHVDHDHNTGEVRGLLCYACNVGIGHLKEDVDLLLAAADYLERNNAS